jgi:hypothetical protein
MTNQTLHVYRNAAFRQTVTAEIPSEMAGADIAEWTFRAQAGTDRAELVMFEVEHVDGLTLLLTAGADELSVLPVKGVKWDVLGMPVDSGPYRLCGGTVQVSSGQTDWEDAGLIVIAGGDADGEAETVYVE